MPPHPLPNCEMQKYSNEPKFKDGYSRNSLPKVKDMSHVTNLEYKSIETH